MVAAFDWVEYAARKFEAPQARWATPGEMAKATNPNTVQTPALDLIDAALVEAFNTPDSRLIISMPPQEGKSVRAANDFPIWVLTQRPELRIVTASYAQSLANRNGRAVRNRILSNPQLGLQIAKDNGSVSEWQIADNEGGLLSVGIGAGVTGQKADMMIIDDPHKDRKEADSEIMRDTVWDWWTDAASARLAPGASVILIQTRWHEDDLAGRLLSRDVEAGWKMLNIPAQADHRPEKGETDVLGRQPGEFMVSARGRTLKQWQQRKATAGAKTWASLYQGAPSPAEGGVFPGTDQWARYNQPMAVQHADGRMHVPGIERHDHELIQSWDMTFKDTKGSDFVVGQVWLRVGAMVYLLDQVRERMNFTATIKAVEAMTAKWPEAHAKLVEDKANGTAVIDSLRSRIPGLIPVEPVGSKYARASAISPFVESRNVVLPEASILPNVSELLEEAKNFPNSSHDDTIDAMSQAVNQLLLHRIDGHGDGLEQPEEYDLIEDQGYYLSPF